MTSQERTLRIQENVNYVNAVISQIKQTFPVNDILVFHGFSQGTAMACRAALLGKYQAHGVMLLGGDIPPEFDVLNPMNRVLIGRGERDRFYTLDKLNQDISRLELSSVIASFCTFDGGHEGHDTYFQAAGKFLKHYLAE